ncbi:MAG: family 1 glycosylhydrolase [Polyangiales bacterium]
MSALELWAGAECTVNRVGDVLFDQVRATGHHDRVGDVDLLASLGARAVRVPILWERTWPDPAAPPDFSWADRTMSRLRALGVRPIVGLVHHGSGPRGTDLLDPGFPAGLARFAERVAARYPWAIDYTPVNEPLTTARFSALYGHWYPHRRDTSSFLRALVHQVRATALAMRAIRALVPDARLVQTEDLGAVAGPASLARQVAYENHRRWLSLDLLFGRVTPAHPLYGHLVASGIDADELRALADEPTPPDLVGVNYYVTSDRYLDDRLARYPAAAHGGNGRDVYVDVEAVRVASAGLRGHEAVLREAWARYRAPLAVTEAHLGCSPEEQVRWLWEAWRGAEAARDAGADVRAVTVWSAFGAYDWDSLVTRAAGRYEPGAFDVRGPAPRPTAVARAARELAKGGRPTHPLAAAPGWWRREGRALDRAEGAMRDELVGRPILVTGAGGALGAAVARACAERGLPVRAMARAELDVADAGAVARALEMLDPWLVVNAAGHARVHDAEDEPEACRARSEGAAVLAEACRRRGARLLAFSSAFVFDGGKGEAYVEDDPVGPINALGRCHVDAERAVLRALPGALVVRAGVLFGAGAGASFLAGALRAACGGGTYAAPDDRFVSLAYLPHLAHACLDLAVDHADGVWHLANEGVASFAAWAHALCNAAGLPATAVLARPADELPLRAALPARAALASARRHRLPPAAEALRAYAAGT